MKLFVLKALNCLFFGSLLAFSQHLLADDSYKCGGRYQDTPCKNSLKAKPSTANSASKKSATLLVNTNCQQRGEVAKSIASLRDTRKTEAQQLQSTTDSDLQALIRDVYNRGGSALQVQSRVERECMQQIAKDKLTKKQWAESEKLRSAGEDSLNESNPKLATPEKAEITETFATLEVAEPEVTTQNRTATKPVQASLPAQKVQTAPAEPEVKTTPPASIKAKTEAKEAVQGDELGICSAFKAGLENIASERRKGGDAATLKELKQQQNQLKNEMKSAGC